MKFSQKWLQEYIEESLPSSEQIVNVLNAKAFEVEGVETFNGDNIYDIKVLPNRAHDALSHMYMAMELCACLNLRFKPIKFDNYNISNDIEKVKLEIVDSKACNRFMSVRIDGVKVGPSVENIKQKLESIGQKSINNIVDITNYVQYTLNKPMHAYDASIVDNGLKARYAVEGEVLVTLDEKELKLDSATLVIADSNKPLGLAGIKGGKYSGINKETKSIIIESANFDPVLIRKTSQKYNIKTDASKRFENGIAVQLACDGLMMTINEILKIFPEAKVSQITDANFADQKVEVVSVSVSEINDLLGAELGEDQIESILKRLGFIYDMDGVVYNIKVPYHRLDLSIKEDMIEEIGRIYGFEFLNPTLPDLSFRNARINKMLYAQNVIRNTLNRNGFAEVFTYSLANEGDLSLLKSASDKSKLRNNITDGLADCLNKNLYNLPLLNQSDVRIFEIGSVFGLSADKKHILESVHLCIAIDDGKKKSDFENVVDVILQEIKNALNVSDLEILKTNLKPRILEINLTGLIENLNDDYKNVFVDDLQSEVKYKAFSPMPFIVRDIAMWCDEATEKERVKQMIIDNAGGLCVSVNLFDEFTKEVDGVKRKSLGYRLVYQDNTRTLTDEEVNTYASNVYDTLKEMNFEIR